MREVNCQFSSGVDKVVGYSFLVSFSILQMLQQTVLGLSVELGLVLVFHSVL